MLCGNTAPRRRYAEHDLTEDEARAYSDGSHPFQWRHNAPVKPIPSMRVRGLFHWVPWSIANVQLAIGPQWARQFKTGELKVESD